MPAKSTSETGLIRSKIFNDDEKTKINTFFFRLKNIYGERYLKQYPTEIEENAVKQEWAPHILALTGNELHEGFEHCKNMMDKKEIGFEWPNPSNVLCGARRYTNPSHRYFVAESYQKAPLEYGQNSLNKLRKILRHPRSPDLEERIHNEMSKE